MGGKNHKSVKKKGKSRRRSIRKKSETLKQVTHQFPLSEEDRITYSYKVDSNKIIREVTCVSYELRVGENWITVIYYDSYHGGVMHRHVKTDLEKNLENINRGGIKKSSTQASLLSWAISNIKENYLDYRRGFIKGNKAYLKKHKIDLY